MNNSAITNINCYEYVQNNKKYDYQIKDRKFCNMSHFHDRIKYEHGDRRRRKPKNKEKKTEQCLMV